MKFILVIATAIVFAGLGFWIGQRSRVGPPAPPMKQVNDDVHEKLQHLVDNDMSEYYRLKGLEDRYKKADDILAKIMSIFLADLGIRMSAENLSLAKQTISSPPVEESTPRADDNAGARSKSGARNKSALVKNPSDTVSEKPGVNLANEKRLGEIRDDHEVNDFLAKSRLDDVYSSLRDTTGLSGSNDDLASINGKFLGMAPVQIDGANKLWEASVKLSVSKTVPNVEGAYQILLSENGKEFSNKTGSGGVGGDFKEFTNGSRALMLQASPQIYIQAFYVKQMDALIGNIYRAPGDNSKFSWAGTVQMNRISH